ncbi:MAG: FadR/GntR family transcriptional regulator [Propionicimonas sp.]
MNSGTAFSRRGLHGQLLNALGSRIVSGELAAGQIINMEQVQTEFQVSRTVVREVLRELSANGLVDARPRYGTFVQERSAWNLLDADVIAWRNAAGPDLRLLRELSEVRILVEPGAARLAAEHATAEQLADIQRALLALEANYGAALDASIDADAAFHLGILRASGNELLERFEVLLLPALSVRNAVTLQHSHDRRYLDLHRTVYDAIAARDPDASEAALRTLLEEARKDTETDLAGLLAGA